MKILEKELNKVRGRWIKCCACKDKLQFIPHGHATYCAQRKCKKCNDKEKAKLLDIYKSKQIN